MNFNNLLGVNDAQNPELGAGDSDGTWDGDKAILIAILRSPPGNVDDSATSWPATGPGKSPLLPIAFIESFLLPKSKLLAIFPNLPNNCQNVCKSPKLAQSRPRQQAQVN